MIFFSCSFYWNIAYGFLIILCTIGICFVRHNGIVPAILNEKSTGKMLSIYVRAQQGNPFRVIGARLMSVQELWNVFKRAGQGDYLAEKTNAPEIERDLGYMLSLFIAMICQNLRYVWAVFPVEILFFLLVKAEYHNEEKRRY